MINPKSQVYVTKSGTWHLNGSCPTDWDSMVKAKTALREYEPCGRCVSGAVLSRLDRLTDGD